jgi:hypothetical protein
VEERRRRRAGARKEERAGGRDSNATEQGCQRAAVAAAGHPAVERGTDGAGAGRRSDRVAEARTPPEWSGRGGPSLRVKPAAVPTGVHSGSSGGPSTRCHAVLHQLCGRLRSAVDVAPPCPVLRARSSRRGQLSPAVRRRCDDRGAGAIFNVPHRRGFCARVPACKIAISAVTCASAQARCRPADLTLPKLTGAPITQPPRPCPAPFPPTRRPGAASADRPAAR